MFTRSKKVVSMLIVFVIVFTYMGQTLEAIATSDGLSAITNGFFGNGEMKFHSYFDENGEQKNEKTSDVNEKATLVFELSPNDIGKGFLKDGMILANSLDESDNNFRFSKIKNITIDEPDVGVDAPIDLENNTNNVGDDAPVDPGNNVDVDISTDSENNEGVDASVDPTNDVKGNTVADDETDLDSNNIENINENIVSDEENETNDVEVNPEKETSNDVTSRSSQPRVGVDDSVDPGNETNNGGDDPKTNNVDANVPIDTNNDLVNEEEVIQNRTEEMTQETYEELTAKDFEIEMIDDNQIKVQNVIYPTKIEVEIEYNKKDTLNVTDLYKKINLQLKGTFINVSLERIQIEENQEITARLDLS